MSDLPSQIRPKGEIANPALYAVAREKWPGIAVTAEMLNDAAKLSGLPASVPPTAEACRAGLAEVARDRRTAEQKAATARDYARLGFDPARDYRNPPSTSE